MSKAKYDHRFSIDRATWANGSFPVRTGNRLLSIDYEHGARQCCIGFYAESCGVPRYNLKNIWTVVGLSNSNALKCVKGELTNVWSDFEKFYLANDSESLSPEARELKIAEMFAKKRIKVTFRGKYPKAAK